MRDDFASKWLIALASLSKSAGKTSVAAVIGVSALSTGSYAATLDFNELAGGNPGSNTIVLSNATIVTEGTDFYIENSTNPLLVGDIPSGGFCGLISSSSVSCATETTITFNEAVSDISFGTAAYAPGDFFTASIFGGTTLLSTIDVSSGMAVNFGTTSGVTSLVLDATASTQNAHIFTNFNFNVSSVPPVSPPVSAVPLPAGGLLFLSGLVGVAGLKRREKTAG